MGCGESKGQHLSDESKFDKVVGDAFERIYAISNFKKGKFINFAPIWVANNTKEGGLGIIKFHFSEQDCHLTRDKLIGNTFVNRDDVVEFYHQVANHKESLGEFDLRGDLHNLTQTMEFVVKFYKENQDQIVQRMEHLVKFFNKVDTPGNKWIDKNELIAFYEHVVEKDLKMDEDHFLLEHKSEADTSFKWIDRNGDGKITLAELVSFALAPSMLTKKHQEWMQQLEVLGIELKYAEDTVPVSAVTDD